MKKVMAAVMVLVMAVMACQVQMAGEDGALVATDVSPTETMRIDIYALTPAQTVRINALKGLRLRDRPDASGPVDSIEIALMPPGSEFKAEKCQEVADHWWAFGTYQGSLGWADADFLEPNPCVIR